MKIVRLSSKQMTALKLATKGELVCAYGNEFFLAGGARFDGVCQRGTLESLRRLGLVAHRLGLSQRGEYRATQRGLEIVAAEELA